MIRYAISMSTMAFEEDAATAISWEHEMSLSGRLERARFASQMASLKHHWENGRGRLRRQHITRKISGNFSTKRGRRQHKHDLRRARANRQRGMTDNPRPAQPEPQFRSAFSFAPPTAHDHPTGNYQGCVHFRRYGTVHAVEHRFCTSVIISNIIAIIVITNIIIIRVIIIIIVRVTKNAFYGTTTQKEA